MRRLLVLALGGLTACGPPTALLDWSEPVAPSPAPAHSPPRLHVEGTTLATEAGQPVHLRGVNVCALEFDAQGANWNLQPDGGSATLDVLADPARWKVNVVRMPVNQEWFLTDDAYVAQIEALLDAAAARDVYVVLDVQWERAKPTTPYQRNILSQPTFGRGNTTEAFWHLASSRFANRTNVLYDLLNEPHDLPADTLAEDFQALVDALHGRTPEAVVVVAGPDWAHSVAFWADHPLRGANTIYSAHQYLPYDDVAHFAGNFERAAAKVPVLLGEFGVDDPSWAGALVEHAEAAGVVGWLPWAIGCGLNLDDDTGAASGLAARLRQLN